MNSFFTAAADAYARHIIEAACGPISDDEITEISRDMLHEAWSGTTEFLQRNRPTKAERERYRDDLMTIARFEPLVARRDAAWAEEQRAAHAPTGHAIAVPHCLGHMPETRHSSCPVWYADEP